MSVLQFAEEFTRLVIRYMRTSNNPDDPPSNVIMPLNNEQIVFTIQRVLDVLQIKEFENKNDNNLLETSIGTSVINLESSIVNIKRELNIEDTCSVTFRCSENVQYVFTSDDSSVSDISQSIIKKERENFFITLQNGKKIISQSNPAKYISNISRADIFDRGEDQNRTKDQEDIINAKQHNLLGNFMPVANEIRKSALDIMEKLTEIRKSATNIVVMLNNLEI
ncbi:uncharacterized protein LOC105840337 [Monomorium pharaonis]|uniref:uncharacterized protein LOC105840337 n=1 Tax=Monomorium pharaonis TaxID=307658 RepID=UPI00063F36C8|nr:uncharacterized protein LOC105840337 [Monomorium pharaonis]